MLFSELAPTLSEDDIQITSSTDGDFRVMFQSVDTLQNDIRSDFIGTGIIYVISDEGDRERVDSVRISLDSTDGVSSACHIEDEAYEQIDNMFEIEFIFNGTFAEPIRKQTNIVSLNL